MHDLAPSDLSILLIEPSSMQRKVIERYLAQESISNISQARTIKDAITSLSSHVPDLIVCALHLEDGNALDLIHTIKEHDVWHEVPFMLISSERRKEQLEQFKQSGVVAILPKPFTSNHLGKAINATIDLLSPNEMDLSFFDVHQLRVLVVDDSRLARNHIKKVLSNLGIQKMTDAQDGQQAIDLLAHSMFDLVVTDYNMPQVNGKELTEHIRNHSNQTHIPVLMVTSEANETHLSNIEQSGVNAMCDKPFEPEVVKRMLYQLLDQD
jgi:two-component system chemotaxis response regulator CheY